MSKHSANKDFWERTAFLYTAVIEKKSTLYPDLCNIISEYLTEDMNVLELACGTGQLTFTLSEKVNHWEATDFSENMVNTAKRRMNGQANISFSVQDATNLPYGDCSYDAVIIANALHIMPSPEKALEEIYRVLKPDGLLYAPTFVYEGKINSRKMWIMEKLGFRTFHKWTCNELANFVNEYDYSVESQSLVQSSPAPSCALIARKSVNNREYL